MEERDWQYNWLFDGSCFKGNDGVCDCTHLSESPLLSSSLTALSSSQAHHADKSLLHLLPSFSSLHLNPFSLSATTAFTLLTSVACLSLILPYFIYFPFKAVIIYQQQGPSDRNCIPVEWFAPSFTFSSRVLTKTALIEIQLHALQPAKCPWKLGQSGVQIKTQRERERAIRETEGKWGGRAAALFACLFLCLSVWLLAVMTSPHDQCTSENCRSPSPETIIFSLQLLSHFFFSISSQSAAISFLHPFLFLSISSSVLPFSEPPAPLLLSRPITSQYLCHFPSRLFL